MQTRGSNVEKRRVISRRLFILTAAKILLFAGITSRLYNLQISDREKYEILSDKNRIKEWKTPPLWGLGYAKEVNPRATFLHDGRAETIIEAVLWHSGEAKNSVNFLLDNYKNDLDKLEKFLNSL